MTELGKKFPTLSFAICSLYKCYEVNAEEETMTEKNSGKDGITRVEFNQALKEVADEFGAIYIDNYNLGVNQYNAPVSFFSWRDGTHPTQEGRIMIANRIAHDLSVKMY